ncbi:hypothetical protein BDW22DRAFT_706892 [Trametopsis cervina]|nr:hypothetical protein BDW22DRAFT_706892 [Trametopsis cervina]
MFFTLPSDLTLYTLSFLPLRDISTLYSLSRSIRNFLLQHEDALYHQLAILHRFAVSGVSLEDTKAAEISRGGHHLKGVKSWKDFCREALILEHNWSGRGFVVVGGYNCFDRDVQEFSIVEDHSLLLARTEGNILHIYSLDGSRLLTVLPNVAQFMHSGRSLLLWRGPHTGGTIEVWRFVDADQLPEQDAIPPIAPPCELAMTGSQAQEHAQMLSSSVITPHGSLPSPLGGWRSYALREPYLALANIDQPRLVHIYNIVRGEVHQLLDLAPILVAQSGELAHFSVLLDLQLSDTYLCACFDSTVVWARLRPEGGGALAAELATTGVGRDACVYEEPDDPWRLRSSAARLKRVVIPSRKVSLGDPVVGLEQGCISHAVAAGADALEEHKATGPRAAAELTPTVFAPNDVETHHYRRQTCFISAKFSPDGRHVVVGTAFGYIYLFPDIQRMFEGDMAGTEIVQKLYFEEPIRVIQWDVLNRAFTIFDVRHLPFVTPARSLFSIGRTPDLARRPDTHDSHRRRAGS